MSKIKDEATIHVSEVPFTNVSLTAPSCQRTSLVSEEALDVIPGHLGLDDKARQDVKEV
jgi:hypothetical protein